VKEAAYKALYPVVRATWKDLTYRSITQGQNGHKPALLYRPVLLEELTKVGKMHVSVSHDGEYVFASVLVEVSPVDESR